MESFNDDDQAGVPADRHWMREAVEASCWQDPSARAREQAGGDRPTRMTRREHQRGEAGTPAMCAIEFHQRGGEVHNRERGNSMIEFL
jgi:hypothetical protein